MVYIYAPSYNSVYFALLNYSIGDFSIITRNKEIRNFSEKTGIVCYYLQAEIDDSVNVLKLYQAELDDFSNQFEGLDVFFGFHLSAIPDLYLLHQLKKKNKVCFKSIDPVHNKERYFPFRILNGSARYKNQLIKRYEEVFKLNLYLYHNGLNYVAGMDVEELRKTFAPYKSCSANDDIWKSNCDKVTQNLADRGMDFIYIDNVSQTDKYIEKVKEMLDLLKERGKNVFIKPHPGIPLHASLSEYPILDADIPVECFQYVVSGAIVGAYSAALNHVSGNVKTISLFNLFDIDNKKWRKNILENFLDKKVLKPANTKEAISLCLE